MSFNFEKAIQESAQERTDLISAIILGPSGAGKSSILGTLPGKILFLHTSSESHGSMAAKTLGGSRVISICIDKENGAPLSPDAAYDRLLSILTSKDGLKKLGVQSVAIDGASELELLIRSTSKWEELCTTAKGKHSGFMESTAAIVMLRTVVSALKDLQSELGVHCAISCILDVKTLGPNGDIEESTPRLQGYSVAESLVQQFPDVLVVSRMHRNGETKHKLQFLTEMTKVSKDDRGSIKKAINFAPRITGMLVGDLPPYMDADLSIVAELKKKLC